MRGLRFQILLALLAALGVAFTTMSLAALQLAERNADDFSARSVAAAEKILAASSDDERLSAIAALPGVAGVAVDGSADVFGQATRDAQLVRSNDQDYVLFRAHDHQSATRFSKLIVSYAVLTGLLLILLTYAALTILIVRPAETLVHAAQRIASGSLDVRAPLAGSREVRDLATAFNSMASALESERNAMRARLLELEETTRTLEIAQEQVARSTKLASVGRISAGVAHEIGNPLTAIIGLVDLAGDPSVDGDLRSELLLRIRSESERIHRIIGDLLSFARDKSVVSTFTSSCSLLEVVTDARKLLNAVGQRQVTVDIPDDLPRVAIDRDKLLQVALNLLFNARDATSENGKIVVQARREATEVVFEVSDDGTGIAPNILDQLFEPFTTTKATGQGTGLGLAVCQQIVAGFEGSIRAYNRDDGGACFEVRLPLSFS